MEKKMETTIMGFLSLRVRCMQAVCIRVESYLLRYFKRLLRRFFVWLSLAVGFTSKKKPGTVKLDHLRLAPCFLGMFLTVHSSHQRRELPITRLRTRGALEIFPISSTTPVKISHVWISKYSQPNPKPPAPQKQAVVHRGLWAIVAASNWGSNLLVAFALCKIRSEIVGLATMLSLKH